MKQRTKITFLLVIWAAVAAQFAVNLYDKNNNKIVDAFQTTNSIPLESTIDIYGYYGQEYLSFDTRENMLVGLAEKIGLSEGYDIIQENGDEFEKVELVKYGEYAKVIIQITSFTKNNGVELKNPKQYITYNVTFYNNVDAVLEYKEQIEKIFEDLGVEPTSNIYLSGTMEGKLDKDTICNMTDKIFDKLNAEKVQEIDFCDSYTVYGYSEEIKQALMENGRKVNVNIAFSYDEVNNQTKIHLAIPLINVSY